MAARTPNAGSSRRLSTPPPSRGLPELRSGSLKAEHFGIQYTCMESVRLFQTLRRWMDQSGLNFQGFNNAWERLQISEIRMIGQLAHEVLAEIKCHWQVYPFKSACL